MLYDHFSSDVLAQLSPASTVLERQLQRRSDQSPAGGGPRCRPGYPGRRHRRRRRPQRKHCSGEREVRGEMRPRSAKSRACQELTMNFDWHARHCCMMAVSANKTLHPKRGAPKHQIKGTRSSFRCRIAGHGARVRGVMFFADAGADSPSPAALRCRRRRSRRRSPCHTPCARASRGGPPEWQD